MKKVFLGLAVVLVIIVGGVIFLFSNLDSLVETAIETAGTQALGTSVEVGSVELALTEGTASIYDFSIANPPGFSNAAMVSFDELSVAINLLNTSGEQIHISSVIARSPYVLYETGNGTSNVDTISERLASDEAAAPENEETTGVNLIIDSILIEDILGTLNSERLPEPVEVSLGNIELDNLEGAPEDLADQIMAPVMAQIASAAAQALIQATADLISGAAEEVGEQLEGALDSVSEQADEVLESVGNLFNRD